MVPKTLLILILLLTIYKTVPAKNHHILNTRYSKRNEQNTITNLYHFSTNPELLNLPTGRHNSFLNKEGKRSHSDYKEKLDSIINGKSFKNEYAYNANGSVNLYIIYEWDGGQWDYFSKYEYTYDSNDKLTLFVDLAWDGSEWENYFKKEYTYDNNGNLATEIWSEYWYETYCIKEWRNLRKYEYTYDDNDNIILLTEYSWESGQWTTFSKNEYTYDSNNNIIQIVKSNLKDSLWVNSIKYAYTYNNAGNTSLLEQYNWKDGTWVEGEKNEYTYDNNNNFILYILYQWKSAQWVNYYKFDVIYDTSTNFYDIAFPHSSDEISPGIFMWYGSYSNKIDSASIYSWDAITSTWKTLANAKYYYSPFIVPILNDHPLINNNATVPLTIQGNQTGSSLTFTNNSGSDIALSIYLLNGKRAKRIVVPQTGLTIDISFLSSGVYFIEYTDRNGVSAITSFMKW